ncbi:ABC transporter substrate-binding protein [Maribacter sp. 2307UL18-2]|uniref:ABC transporter substrate-binding protein n=1 Tax=Maribacter sp. 2307UL18-2 TaxID=3386274 RepID=UPI0039BD29D2
MKYKFFFLSCLLGFFSCGEKESVTRYTSWQSSQTEEQIIRKTLADFEKEHPTVPFQFQPIPGNYTEKLQLMLGTGKAPDLFWLKGDTSPAYMNFEVLEPLDGFLQKDPDFDYDDFFPVFQDAFKYKGKNYGIAKDFNAYVFFYNKKMFREAGLTEPPKDWKELYEYSKKLTKDTNGDGKTDQYGFVIEPSIDIVLPFAYQNGGEIISDNGEIKIGQPEFIEAAKFMMSLYRDGIATNPADMGAGWLGDVFSRKQCAMTISGAWLIPYLQDNSPDLEYGVAELPKGKKRATMAFSVAMVIPKQSERKEEAWTMLSYLTGKEGMKTWTESGIALPTRKSVAEENGFYQDSILNTFMKSIEYATLYKVNMKERWFDESQAAMQAIFYKNKDIEKTLKELAVTLEKYKLD